MTPASPDCIAPPPDHRLGFDAIEARFDAILHELEQPRPQLAPLAVTAELITLGETVLERWIVARGEQPTADAKEGFRLLALHRQGARGEPSFNACRETCRELVYHHNLVASQPDHEDVMQRVMLAVMVARHLVLFVSGKMEVEGLGEFCCSSQPLRATGN